MGTHLTTKIGESGWLGMFSFFLTRIHPGIKDRLVVPNEVQDYIVDFLHDSKSTLMACALVCKLWAASSRYHLRGPQQIIACIVYTDHFYTRGSSPYTTRGRLESCGVCHPNHGYFRNEPSQVSGAGTGKKRPWFHHQG
jgi:hypothetical protein